jgi:hypothetical protein
MKNGLRLTQDLLTAEQEDHRETRDSVNALKAQIQEFMAVRNKNTFIAFLTFLRVLYTFYIAGRGPAYPECR